MLRGDPGARVVQFLLPPGNTPYLPGDGLLPSDLDGTTMPPHGSPNYFVGTMDDGAGRGAPFDGINVFAFSVRWSGHPTGSFSLAAQLPVASFDSIFPCDPSSTRSCIPQPGTGNKIDILSYRQRPTFRLAYRNFGTYESLLVNQSAQIRSSSSQTGVRWYEVRDPNGAPFVYQQSTFAPDTTRYRWMGAVAQDKQGNMLVGYSASSSTLYPSIGYSGRLATDPVNQLQTEFVSFFGTGSQTTYSRWGDYSSVAVDPVDDCTFWFAGEYLVTTGVFNWHTRLESLKFSTCQ